MPHRPPPRFRRRPKRNSLATAGRVVEIVADAAGLVLRLRDRPNALDWLALGACGAGLAHRVWAEASAMRAPDPSTAFATDGPASDWEVASPVFAPWFLEHAQDVHAYPAAPRDSERVVHARIGEETIGWIECNETGSVERGPYFVAARREQTLAALGESLWRHAPSQHLTISGSGLRPGLETPAELATRSLVSLEDRLRKFWHAEVPRSVLLLGPPGTGKTTAAGQLAERIGNRSVRIDVAAMMQVLRNCSSWKYDGADEPDQNLEALVECLRPDTLLIDDIDRIDGGPELLAVIERVRRSCRIVIATANCDGGMLGALLRPGRFDEIVEVADPDPNLVRDLLGDDRDLAERMASWPIAWIVEYVTRRDVLGREGARAELEGLESRLREIGTRTHGENQQAARKLRSV